MRRFTLIKSKKVRMLAALYLGFQLTMGLATVANLFLSVPPAEAAAKSTLSCFDQKECESSVYKGVFPKPTLEDTARCGAGRGPCYAKPAPVNLTVNIGGVGRVVDLGEYIATVYKYGTGVAAVVAAVMMMLGGFQYLTAGGDSGRVTAAKERIQDAVVGLMLALSAFVILQTVNPDLVALKLPQVPLMRRLTITPQCAFTELKAKCGATYYVTKANPDAPDYSTNPEDFNVVDDPGSADVMAKCVGKSCKMAGSNDVGYRCVENKTAAAPPKPCAADADCGAQKCVNGACATETDPKGPVPPYDCKTCSGYGDSCAPNGPNDKCCSGMCGNGSCTTGYPGDSCQANNECITGICQTRRSSSCSAGRVGSPCKTDKECTGGNVCIEEDGYYICVPPKIGGFCADDSDCPSSSKCLINTQSRKTYCAPPGATVSDWCVMNSGCPTNYCVTLMNTCTDRSVGSPCARDENCDSGICVTSAVTGIVGGVCGDGQPGSRCDGNDDCRKRNGDKPGYCFKSWLTTDFGTCTTGDAGVACTSNDGCSTGFCDPRNKRCWVK